MNNTYYDIFEIPSSASQDDIKNAYRRLAMKYHPDRSQDKELGEIKMKEINFIYSILSNPDKRKWYDSTISLNQEYEEENYSYSYSSIFCDEVEVTDCVGNKTKLKIGDNIYYLVEIDKSIITWKYKRKEYFNLVVKNIFDPDKKDFYAKAIKFDFNKTPLCVAHWGNSGMIIYKEDYESYWLSQASYSKIDKRKGIIAGVIILILLFFGFFYFHSKFSISSDRAEYLKNKIKENLESTEDAKQYYKNEYYASDVEVSYILSDFYTVCEKESTLTKEEVDVLSIPSKLGIIKGEIPKGKNVILLLFCPSQNFYKVKFRDLVGWVPGWHLENLDSLEKSQGEE
ncbi:MAG: DnaJ domain-containing protein [Bacteroidetes bacterium]|nr:DnaJ domain-containing protein [Bacteroidota bacterium]